MDWAHNFLRIRFGEHFTGWRGQLNLHLQVALDWKLFVVGTRCLGRVPGLTKVLVRHKIVSLTRERFPLVPQIHLAATFMNCVESCPQCPNLR